MTTPHPNSRLYVDQPLNEGALITLDKPQAHYIAQVMRLKLGASVALFNGVDGEWWGEITALDRKSASLQLFKQSRTQTAEPDIHLLFAPIKFGKIDFLAQKATELGVSALQPVQTHRTVVSRVNEERLQANMIEASEQSKRLTLPQLLPYNSLEKILSTWPQTGENARTLIYADETGQGKPPTELFPTLCSDSATPPKLAVLIGPEGGFDPKELQILRTLPFTHGLNLGPRILRADTAALSALACTMAFCGGWQ